MGLIFDRFTVSRSEFRLEVSFASEAGWLAVFGRSGSGKTTLLEAVAGLLEPSGGRLEVDGTVFFDAAASRTLPPRRRGIGYVRQSPDLFPKMTVEENIRFAKRRGRGHERFAAGEVFDAFGLEHLRRRLPAELSGGETRRVQIARAAASAPALLLLDEPLANLDESSRRELAPAFTALKESFSLPAILVSHRFDEVVTLADQVIVLEGGRLVAQGEPFATLSRPAAWPVAKLAGVENVLAGTVREPEDGEGGTLVEWEGVRWHVPRLSAPLGAPAALGLFAADVLLARELSGRISARNCLEARVERVSESAGEALVELRLGSGRLIARVTRGALRELEIVPGAAVRVLVKSTAFQVLR